jgi:RluA family pseudouridine synthase
MNIPIIFEDQNIVVINKPESISSIKGNDKSNFCVYDILSKQLNQKLYIVHRLDKYVSGVMLFAKNAFSHKFLSKQFEHHDVKKTYLALLHGKLNKKKGEIIKPIRQFGSGRMGIDIIKGKSSITKFEVVEIFSNSTLVKAMPVTGRKHQIRVHFYSINHPVVGDLLYGDKKIQSSFERLMLHSFQISFIGLDSKIKTFSCMPPKSFQRVIDYIKNKS